MRFLIISGYKYAFKINVLSLRIFILLLIRSNLIVFFSSLRLWLIELKIWDAATLVFSSYWLVLRLLVLFFSLWHFGRNLFKPPVHFTRLSFLTMVKSEKGTHREIHCNTWVHEDVRGGGCAPFPLPGLITRYTSHPTPPLCGLRGYESKF